LYVDGDYGQLVLETKWVDFEHAHFVLRHFRTIRKNEKKLVKFSKKNLEKFQSPKIYIGNFQSCGKSPERSRNGIKKFGFFPEKFSKSENLSKDFRKFQTRGKSILRSRNGIRTFRRVPTRDGWGGRGSKHFFSDAPR
jgi:hypothetical protein